MFLKPSKDMGRDPKLKSSNKTHFSQEHMNVWLGNGPFIFWNKNSRRSSIGTEVSPLRKFILMSVHFMRGLLFNPACAIEVLPNEDARQIVQACGC